MTGVTLNGAIKRYGDGQVIHGIDLKVEDGEFCVFVGPSGCGKSTLLRMIAGLEETTEGTVQIGARDVTHADPSERGVAMGRAIVRGPEVFLFDEPLSNLDAELRVEMRVEIARLHKEIGATMIYVTHDQVEAMTLADKIVVLRAGVIEQVGAPLELYRDPDNKFVAGFIGSPAMNFLNGTVRGKAVDVPALGRKVEVTAQLPADGAKVVIGIRPEHIDVQQETGDLKAELSEALGGVSYLHLDTLSGERIICEERGDDRAREGGTVDITFEPRRVMVFDAETEARLR